ncbi:MAG: FAD-dependent oxidoreductase [Pseudomonadales bacterium]|nr:FAD-dependent oxidoreductase [Pseudomonadales bacterium]MCP5191473.1 FAD-dependent oxidoreductase [Pseudomonadales bacterium]
MKSKPINERSTDAGISRRQMLLAATGTALATTVAGTASLAANKVMGKPEGADANVLDVVVIGAGLAGLTAARDLMQAGRNAFVVLEANDRVGGRTLNHKLAGGHYSEAGGQWVGPGQTAVYDLCRELNIGMFPTYLKGKSVYRAADGSMYAEDAGGTFSVGPELEKVIEKLNELAAEVPSSAPWTAPRAAELDAISLAEFVKPYGLNPLDTLSLDLGLRLTDTIHYQEVSLLYALSRINYAGSYEQLEGFAGGAQEQRIENGSQYISEVLAAGIGDRLRLSTPVRSITEWDSDVVSVHTDNSVFRAREVIMAISPALCNKVAFEPDLPKKRQALQQTWPAFAPGRKTAHVYSRPFWRDAGYNGWLFDIGGEVMWAYDNSPEDGSIGVINAFIYPAMSNDPAVLAPQLAHLYAEAFGEAALDYSEFHDQDWGEEPWCMSCVSPLTPGFLTSGLMEALRAPIGSLVWAGTETAQIWQTYMDGAVRSGHRAALEALSGLASQAQEACL